MAVKRNYKACRLAPYGALEHPSLERTQRHGIFKIRKDIPFMKNAVAFNAISFITFIAAVFFLFSRGLHLSVEFTGGTLMEVSYSQAADLNVVRAQIAKLGLNDVQVQNFGTARDVMIRMPPAKGQSSAQQSEQVLTALKRRTRISIASYRVCWTSSGRRVGD